MIHSFAITNYLGDRIKLDLREPEVSGFLIKSVTGLGPVKATVNTTEVVTNDGSMFNSARLSQRNIVFQIVFVDTVYGETIEDIRQKSYKYFPAKKNVEIIIETDNRYVRTSGYRKCYSGWQLRRLHQQHEDGSIRTAACYCKRFQQHL